MKLIFLLATILLVFAIPQLQAQAITDLPAIGGGGGGEFRDLCPVNQVLRGFSLHAADDVDAIQILCLGTHGQRDYNPPFHGGSGGVFTPLLCDEHTPAVVGLYIAAEGQHTLVVNNIHMFCGSTEDGKRLVSYPDAKFDGPPAKGPGDIFAHFGLNPLTASQFCPAGQVAIGIHGRSGIWLDAVGLICGTSPFFRSGNVIGSIGRVPVPVGSKAGSGLSICDAAAAAHVRNSPAAANLDHNCQLLIAANEKADLAPGPDGAPVSLCDAAQQALNRNAPEAADLSAKCRATGGGQNLKSQADQYFESGRSIVSADPLLFELYNFAAATGSLQRGFFIAAAVTGANTAWGPGKQMVLDSLKPNEQEGFKIAASFLLDRNRNANLASLGASIAKSIPAIAVARTANRDPRYWLGFDIATGLFGPADHGGMGHTATGPNSNAIRDSLSVEVRKGFDESTTFNLSRDR